MTHPRPDLLTRVLFGTGCVMALVGLLLPIAACTAHVAWGDHQEHRPRVVTPGPLWSPRPTHDDPHEPGHTPAQTALLTTTR